MQLANFDEIAVEQVVDEDVLRDWVVEKAMNNGWFTNEDAVEFDEFSCTTQSILYEEVCQQKLKKARNLPHYQLPQLSAPVTLFTELLKD